MEQDLPIIRVSLFEKLADRRWISVAACLLAGVAVLIFYFQSGPKAFDFARAESLVMKWAALPNDDSLFTEMIQALNKVPALQKRYEPVIAQKLLEGGRGAEALQIAYRSLDLARTEAPYHAHFAETSLLIEQEEYQTALERAAALKERMARECNMDAFCGSQLTGGALLFAHNLLRIACLQKELKNEPGERAAWNELEGFLKKIEKSPVAAVFVHSFGEKGLDLTHYIAQRKSSLSRP